MRTAIHRIAAALIAVAAIIGITSVTSNTAHAQCSPIGFTNTSGCYAEIKLYDAGGNTWTISRTSGYGIQYVTPPTGFVPAGVTSAGGNNYPFIPAGQPGFGCTACIAVNDLANPGNTCCVSVCWGSVQCGIGVVACGGTCQP